MSVVKTWSSGERIWLEIEGQRLEARTWGAPPDQAPTIVLLHEGLGSVAQWKGFPEALVASTGCGVFAYSRQGYGQSSPAALPRPLDYMWREATEVLPQVLAAIDAQQVVLLGHSDGASIAAIHAGRCDDARVLGVCMMAPHFFTEPEGLAAIAEAKVAFETGELRERLAKYHVDPDGAFRGWNDAWLDPGFVDWTIEAVLPDIDVPALVLQGRDDPYGTLAQVRALEERVTGPLDTVLLDACKHAPHLEQPGLTLDAVATFLAQVKPSASLAFGGR